MKAKMFPHEYRVSLFEPSNSNYRHFSLVIQRVYEDGAYTDQWVISDGFNGGDYLSKQGRWLSKWDYSYNRGVWKAKVRFDTPEEAEIIAAAWLPQMTVNGHTAEDVVRLGLEG